MAWRNLFYSFIHTEKHTKKKKYVILSKVKKKLFIYTYNERGKKKVNSNSNEAKTYLQIYYNLLYQGFISWWEVHNFSKFLNEKKSYGLFAQYETFVACGGR